ncbi:MAG: MmcQ/YjbR family DNA-binding protein [Planctomycetota bacterium]
MTPAQYLARLRSLCKRLPATGEQASWGHPNFTAGGRIFAAVEVHKGRPCMAIATSREEQALLVHDPHFMVAPYTGKYGWVSALLDTQPPWEMLEPLLCDAHARKLALAAMKPARRPSRSRTRK